MGVLLCFGEPNFHPLLPLNPAWMEDEGWMGEPGVAGTADGDSEPEPLLPELPAPAVGMDIPNMGPW